MTQAIKLLTTVTVGTTPVQVDAHATSVTRQFRSMTLQADAGNSGTIYVGDSTVSTTTYARALAASDWMTLSGDAVDGKDVWVVASSAGQVLHPSGF